MRKLLTALVIFGLSACESETQTRVVTPVVASVDQSQVRGDECQRIIDFAQVCYDNSNPGVSCAAVHEVMDAVAEDHNLRPSERDTLAKFCEYMCVARHNGYGWGAVRRELRNACE